MRSNLGPLLLALGLGLAFGGSGLNAGVARASSGNAYLAVYPNPIPLSASTNCYNFDDGTCISIANVGSEVRYQYLSTSPAPAVCNDNCVVGVTVASCCGNTNGPYSYTWYVPTDEASSTCIWYIYSPQEAGVCRANPYIRNSLVLVSGAPDSPPADASWSTAVYSYNGNPCVETWADGRYIGDTGSLAGVAWVFSGLNQALTADTVATPSAYGGTYVVGNNVWISTNTTSGNAVNWYNNSGGALLASNVASGSGFNWNPGSPGRYYFYGTTQGEVPMGGCDSSSYYTTTSPVWYFDVVALPSTSISVAGTPGTGGWYKSATVTITCTPGAGGPACSSSYYQINGGATQTYAGPFVLPDGIQSIAAWSKDSLGDVSPTVTQTYKVDGTPPVVTASANPAAPDGTGGWYKTAPTFTASCTDATSGCAGITKIINGVSSAYTGPFTLSPSATPQTVSITATDNAGNTVVTPWSWSGKVDSATPTLTVTTNPSSPDGGNGWYETLPTFTATCSDPFSGCSAMPISYTINGGAPIPCANNCAVNVPDGTYTYVVTATSGSGNTTTQTLTFKVDDGANFATGTLTAPATGTTFCTPAECGFISGGTPLPTPLVLSWTAGSDTCAGGCAGIGGYWVTISKKSDLTSPVVSANVGNVLSYNGFTPNPDSTYYWDVQAYTNAEPTPGTVDGKND
ncbi:MAG: hypothetical protein ACYDAG_18940, partial [Chloroflexota bacterium]